MRPGSGRGRGRDRDGNPRQAEEPRNPGVPGAEEAGAGQTERQKDSRGPREWRGGDVGRKGQNAETEQRLRPKKKRERQTDSQERSKEGQEGGPQNET